LKTRFILDKVYREFIIQVFVLFKDRNTVVLRKCPLLNLC